MESTYKLLFVFLNFDSIVFARRFEPFMVFFFFVFFVFVCFISSCILLNFCRELPMEHQRRIIGYQDLDAPQYDLDASMFS